MWKFRIGIFFVCVCGCSIRNELRDGDRWGEGRGVGPLFVTHPALVGNCFTKPDLLSGASQQSSRLFSSKIVEIREGAAYSGNALLHSAFSPEKKNFRWIKCLTNTLGKFLWTPYKREKGSQSYHLWIKSKGGLVFVFSFFFRVFLGGWGFCPHEGQ